jgi:hypothetical protein
MLMAVMMPREKSTDERLDDLNEKVDRGFEEVKTELRALDARFDALNRNLIAGLFVVVAAIVGSHAI